jgi:hypothetical protein
MTRLLAHTATTTYNTEDTTADCPICGHPLTEQRDTYPTEVWYPTERDGWRLQCDQGHKYVTTWADDTDQWGDLTTATSRPMNRRERRASQRARR